MAEREKESDCEYRQFVLRPNSSMSSRQAFVFFIGVAMVSMTIGITFTVLGYWVILPFYGVELLALGLGLYITMRDSARLEVITMTESRVRVEKGVGRPEQQSEFIRGWAKVFLLRSKRYGRPSRLVIRSHGKEVEVGCFLVESEREALAVELKSLL